MCRRLILYRVCSAGCRLLAMSPARRCRCHLSHDSVRHTLHDQFRKICLNFSFPCQKMALSETGFSLNGYGDRRGACDWPDSSLVAFWQQLDTCSVRLPPLAPLWKAPRISQPSPSGSRTHRSEGSSWVRATSAAKSACAWREHSRQYRDSASAGPPSCATR